MNNQFFGKKLVYFIIIYLILAKTAVKMMKSYRYQHLTLHLLKRRDLLKPRPLVEATPPALAQRI